VRGRKRHILVDSLGLLLNVLVTPAAVSDRDGGQSMIEQTKVVLSRLRTIFADGVYNGSFASFCRDVGWNLQIVRRCDKPGFHVLPKRWIVERTFAWITRNRRLTADYETNLSTSEAFIQLAMIRLMLARLAR